MKITLVTFKVNFERITEYGKDNCNYKNSITLDLFNYPNFDNWDQIRFINQKIRENIIQNFSFGGKLKNIFPEIEYCKTESITFHNDKQHPKEKYL